ncbi:MAG: Nif3-like dinuclear metal center hexameric protein [Tannerellaceae bacterium]|jgi:dinuclear metal center YbgI/SA1388 family protein|nr:Nif3-like dinuclear metal center hexameric protein [Tannerellaceae bacterium]
MFIKEILNEIEQYAPLPLQESFDNAGIQTGDVNRSATGALLCLDVTEAVINEAIGKGCNLIISHHPLAFKPLKSLTGSTYVERCIIKACKHDLVIYSAHTNLDNAAQGINYHLGHLLGLRQMRILSPQKNALLKLVTFVPTSFAQAVREALFHAGAGHIGNYDSCSFNQEGEGTFRVGEDCRPFCGTPGVLHHEKEVRIETILPAFRRNAVTRALLSAHPYEEPAFDFYPLGNAWNMAGSGMIGELPESEEAHRFLLRIKELFRASCVKHSAIPGKEIRKVALCGGSGAFLLPEAITSEADVFITGEAKYNDFYDVEDRILLAVVGHYETEICAKDIFCKIISEKFPTFALHLSNVNSNPVKYL